MLAKQGPRCRAAILDSPRFSGPSNRLTDSRGRSPLNELPLSSWRFLTRHYRCPFLLLLSLLSPSYSSRTLALIIKHLRSLRLLLLLFLFYSFHHHQVSVSHRPPRSRKLIFDFCTEPLTIDISVWKHWKWFVKINFSTRAIFSAFSSIIIVYMSHTDLKTHIK